MCQNVAAAGFSLLSPLPSLPLFLSPPLSLPLPRLSQGWIWQPLPRRQLPSSFSAQFLEKPADWALRVGSSGHSNHSRKIAVRFPLNSAVSSGGPDSASVSCPLWKGLLGFPHLGINASGVHQAWCMRQPALLSDHGLSSTHCHRRCCRSPRV